MKKYIIHFVVLACFGVVEATNNHILNEEQQNDLMRQVMQIIWEEAMEAKEASNNALPLLREELLENLCSSAPRDYFITHADLSDSLTQAENTSASVFVSSDNQNSWIENSEVTPLDIEGYETTWGATTQITNSGNVSWYLSGSVESSSLGFDFGQITVSQSPYNQNDAWPPSNNLYATLVEDSSNDTGSAFDIVNLRGTYSDDKLYASLGLEGSCCDAGSFFGPWNLYAIAVVNPEAANPVAYAYGWGDGGFGQLYPAVYKIDGDLTTGEVAGFEVLSENFNYSTSGNNFQATSDLSILTNDVDWGEWPNSLNGVALVGVTIEAGLSGIDISTTILDQTDVGVLIMSTQSQGGNINPILSNPTYENNTLQVTYADEDNNLATEHSVLIEGDMMFNMLPLEHTYSEGAVFQLSDINTSGVVEFVFSDGGGDVITLEYDLGGGSSCQLLGDANNDFTVNVLDVVLTVNLILSGLDNYEECSDINGDGVLNVLDIVALINIILGP